jgi:hypothetical protein
MGPGEGYVTRPGHDAMDERAAKVSELLHEAAETHHRVFRLDKEYTERRPDQRWEDYYARELLRHFGSG